MPLFALAKYGEELVCRGLIPALGWSRVTAPFSLLIGDDGKLLAIKDLRFSVIMGKKPYIKSPEMDVPYKVKHSNAPTAFFLCDNANYFLGIGIPVTVNTAGKKQGDDPDKVAARFGSARALHKKLLGPIKSAKAQAICRFFDKWDPSYAAALPSFGLIKDDLLMATNLVFEFEDGSYATKDSEIAEAWNNYYMETTTSGKLEYGTCLVTGQQNVPLARIHPATTGVPGGQSAGSYLVSFGTNPGLSAFNYFDKRQGYNAPTSMVVAEYYGKALRYLFRNSRHHKMIGDTHLLFWAAHDSKSVAAEALSMMLFGRQPKLFDGEDDEALYHTVNSILYGSVAADTFQEEAVALNDDFYLLAIRPHAARLAITRFEHGAFGTFVGHIRKHYDETGIIGEGGEVKQYCFSDMLYVLADGNGNKVISPSVEEEFLNAVLTGTRYPDALLDLLLRRIRVDGKIQGGRCAMLRGLLLRNAKSENVKEAATVALNTESNYPPYLLGQLFWHFEQLQKVALGKRKINRSIKDQFFASAMSQPAKVFPILAGKSEHHLASVKNNHDSAGLGRYYEKLIGGLYDRLDFPLPSLLSRENQSAFVLGYYHAKEESFKPAK